MMMNLFLWGLLFTLTTGIFTYSTLLTSAARTFEGLDVSLAQSAVVAIDEVAGVAGAPYFETSLFDQRVRAYFVQGLRSYFDSSDWSLSIVYDGYRVKPANGQALYPSVATVGFRCAILDLFTYQNDKTFTIVTGDIYVA
jgi:hypothetical protein